MNPIYIIKDGKIYQKLDGGKAVLVKVKDGVVEPTKEEIEIDANEFAYTFYEIKAKFNDLFDVADDFGDDEFNKVIADKDKTIKELKAYIKELEDTIEKLTKELEEYKKDGSDKKSK